MGAWEERPQSGMWLKTFVSLFALVRYHNICITKRADDGDLRREHGVDTWVTGKRKDGEETDGLRSCKLGEGSRQSWPSIYLLCTSRQEQLSYSPSLLPYLTPTPTPHGRTEL